MTEKTMSEQSYDLNNAAGAILDHAAEIIAIAVANIEGDSSLGRYLVLKELWERITELAGLNADELREKADELEEAVEEVDEDYAADLAEIKARGGVRFEL